MTIIFTNASASSGSRISGYAYLVSALVFLIFPAAIIAIGFYASQPTGTLISPLPSTQVSETITPTVSNNTPIIASDKEVIESTSSASTNSNAVANQAKIPAGALQIEVKDDRISSNSQILLVPTSGDSSVYFVVSKESGKFVIGADSSSNAERLIDYQIVNP